MSYWYDWMDVLQQDERLKTTFIGLETFPRRMCKSPFWLPKLLKSEIVILLHSVWTGDCSQSCKLPSWLMHLLSYRKGKLIVFLGNEYKDFSFKNKFLKKTQCDLLISMLPQDIAEAVYPEMDGRVISMPHGADEKIFFPEIPLEKRTISIGTRSVKYPPIVGDTDRNDILEYITNHSNGLTIDISQDHNKRFEREKWAHFLNSCRATPSTEAGAIYIDAKGSYQMMLEEILARQGDENIDYERIAQKCKDDGHRLVSGKTISSRNFEAMATKTVQVMFVGRFNDLLIPDVHYLALNRDFTNWEEIKDKIQNPNHMQIMADEAFDLFINNHTYRCRGNQLMEHVEGIL